MRPPRASSAGKPSRAASEASPTPQQMAGAIAEFLERYPAASVVEDGKVLFSLGEGGARYTLSTEHGRCTLQVWSEDRTAVRRVVSVAEREGVLRLGTLRFGQTRSKLLELVSDRGRKTLTARETGRLGYVSVLERALAGEFADWRPEGFRTARDLKESFGPAYARGTLVRGSQAWAVIGVNAGESATTVDGILTVGILWLHRCREAAGGRRLFQGLKVVVPTGGAMLTLSRMAWMSNESAQWELWEMDERAGELVQRDLDDQGNVRTRLVHHPAEEAAAERFGDAVEQVMSLVPAGEAQRIEQRLRSTAELAFFVHGLEFARARIGLAPNSFARTLEVTVGVGSAETRLTEASRVELRALVAELLERRRAAEVSRFVPKAYAPARRIGSPTTAAAHGRVPGKVARGEKVGVNDPLYRAAPERWLESVLRRDLSPLTRGLTQQRGDHNVSGEQYANEEDPDTVGNRADIVGGTRAGRPATPQDDPYGWGAGRSAANQDNSAFDRTSPVIPRLDPRHVYAQVPAIAGASDRGLLDLLGVTADGRLAVIELKADEDMHFALQGLDYWIRVRQHHLAAADARSGTGEFQRHGYFRGVELSPRAPRLYLVAPALRIHPATEIVLRYVSKKVEWSLLALDERWRQEIRVVWRRQGGVGE